MVKKANLDKVYAISEEVVAREIQDELVIVPITSGAASLEEELYTLNDSGRAIWKALDGKNSLKAAIRKLSAQFDAEPSVIEKDVLGLVAELLKRRMLVEKR